MDPLLNSHEGILCILFLLFSLCLPVVLFITYRTKNVFLRWLCVIYPVLLMFILFFFPVDIGSILLWLFAFLGVAVFVFFLFLNIIRRLLRKDVPYFRLRFVRPLLAVMVFVSAVYAHKYSLEHAEKYAIQNAKKVQEIANQTGRCPLHLEGWPESTEDSGKYRSVKKYGRIGPKFPLSYSSNGVEFEFRVRHNFDASFYVEGGVDKELNAYVFVSGNTIEVPIKD